VDRLLTEMRRGIIYSVVERGMGGDVRRLRLTFTAVRAPGRWWSSAVGP